MFSNLRTFREFSRDARLLIAASGIISVSFFGVQMLLKLLYVIRLGYGPEYVGWYNATGALVFMAMGLPSGALGARFGTRRVMIAGGIGAVLGMALLPTTEFVPFWAQSVWPFVSQVFLTCGWSLFTVNMVPALTAATTDSGRQHAYALNNALVGLGTFCGTVIGGLLPGMFGSLLRIDLDQAAPYRWALLVGASLGIAALLPLTLIRSSSSGSTRAQVQRRGRFPVLAVVPVLLYIYLRHAGWATCQAFCNAYMDTELRLPTASIGLLTGIGQAIAILAPLLTPHLATRWGNGWTLTIVTLGNALFLLPLALVPHWTAASLGRLGILVLASIWLPALQVFQMELVNSEWRSLAYGLASTAMGSGFGSTSMAGGYIIAAWGYDSLFLIGAVLSVIAAALMWGIRHRTASRPT